MILSYALPDGWWLRGRRKERGPGSLCVDLMLHSPDGEWQACLGEARWSPSDRVLVLREGVSRAAIAQHGIPDVDALLREVAELVGFPVKEEAA